MRRWVMTRDDAIAVAITLGFLVGVAALWLIVELGVFALRIPI